MEEAETVNSVDTQVAPDLNAETMHEEPSSQVIEAPVESRQNRNFKELRRQKDELERKLRMQDEMLERMLKTQPQQPQEVDEVDQIEDTEVLQKGHTKKLIRKEAQAIAKEIVQQELSQVRKQFDQATYHNRLKSQFSDFDEIVNQESLALLEEQEPELAVTIAESQDPYKILYQSYKFIKKLGINEQVPKARHSREVEKKIEKNAKSVQSPQAHDKRPMAVAFQMTESMREELAKEMNYYARRASSVPEMG